MIKKIFWVTLVITVLVWVGIGVYYFSTTQVSPSTSLTESLPEISPVLLEDDYISIKKNKTLSGYLLFLTYEGALENKTDDEWTIKAEQESIVFRVFPKTKFFQSTMEAEVEEKKEISQEQIRLGDLLQVTVAVVEKEGFTREIDVGDLRNQNTITVTLLVSKSR